MKKPDIVYCKRISPNSDKVGIDKYVNGFGKNNPILEVDEEIANRIVFFDDMVEALIGARNFVKVHHEYNLTIDVELLNKIEQVLTKVGRHEK